MLRQLFLLLLVVILVVFLLFLVLPELFLNFFDFLVKCLENLVPLLLERLGHFLLLFVNVFQNFFMSGMNLFDVTTAVALHYLLVLLLQLFKLIYFFFLFFVVDVNAL